MKIKIYLLMLFIGISSILYGQNKNLYNFRIDNNPSIEYSVYNNKQVIDKIAKSKNINAQNLNYKYKISFLQRVVNPNPNQLKVVVKISNIIQPKIDYKSFGLNNTLLPEKISFKIHLYKNNKEVSIYNGVCNLETGSSVVNLQTDSLINNNQKYSIKLTNIIVKYTKSGVSNFNTWSNLVDLYDDAVIVNDNFSKQLQSIPTDQNSLSLIPDLSKVNDYDETALRATNFVQSTRQSSFFNTLDINNNDPKNLNGKLDILFQKSSNIHSSCTNVINKLDLIYYDRGEIDYRRKNYQEALFNFNKSIEENPNFTPSHYMIAEIAYNMGNYVDCENVLKNILINIGGDNNILNQTRDLAIELYNTYLSLGENQLSAKKYDDALAWFYKAQDFCNSLNEINCDNRLMNDFAAVYTDKMNFMLQNVDNSMKNFQMQEAENNLKQAIVFRKSNIQYLKDDKPLENKSFEVYNKYLSLGDNARKDKNYEIAINNYNRAKDFCTNNEYVQCPGDMDGLITNVKYDQYNDNIKDAEANYNYGKIDDAEKWLLIAENFRSENNLQVSSKYEQLDKKIKQKKYYNYITSGLAKVKKYEYQAGLDEFAAAQKIETEYTIKRNYNLSSYVNSTAKKLVLQKIDLAETNVKKNNLDQARSITQEAREIADKYAVTNDRKVKYAFDEINKKIFSQECVNYKNEYNDYLAQAKSELAKKDYLLADNFLKKAKNVSSSHPNCYINTSDVDNKITEIKDVVDYYKSFESAKTKYSRNNYSDALSDIEKSTKVFKDKKLDTRYGVKAITLKEFVTTRSNDFILYTAGFFLSNKEYEDALEMLNNLKNKGMKNKKTKSIQTELGAKLAVKDFANMPSLNPKSSVLKYTFNDKWFKYLYKSYTKTWKKIK